MLAISNRVVHHILVLFFTQQENGMGDGKHKLKQQKILIIKRADKIN